MKKTLIIIFTLLFTFSSFALSANGVVEVEPGDQEIVEIEIGIDAEIVYGDVTGDGKVSILDSAYIFFSQVGIVNFDESQKLAADVNGDGLINYDDVKSVFQYSFKTITSFPIEEDFWPEGTPIEVDCDEFGRPDVFLFKRFRDVPLTELEASFTGTAIWKEYNLNLNFDIGISKNVCFYLDFVVKQAANLKLISDIAHVRAMFKNGTFYTILPSINSYSTDLYMEENNFINILDQFNSEFAGVLTSVAFNNYLGSTSVVCNGVNYICEKYQNLFYSETSKCYFTVGGTLKRIEIYNGDSPQFIIIIRSESDTVNRSMTEIPFYYIEVKEDVLKKFGDIISK
ncbi:MAG: dockerin type I repeat-containing protein [Clostridia bacterium]|nr:dockerin type I repeat-containing protein [Clostridia bacterium]